MWRAGFTGLTGFLAEPQQIVDANFPVVDGKVRCPSLPSSSLRTSPSSPRPCRRRPTPTGSSGTRRRTPRGWPPPPQTPTRGRAATRTGPHRTGTYVQGITGATSKATFDVDVPVDGNYRRICSRPVTRRRTCRRSRAAPTRTSARAGVLRQDRRSAVVQDVPPSRLHQQPVRDDDRVHRPYCGCHTISFSKFNQDTGEAGQGNATLDAIELTLAGEPGAPRSYGSRRSTRTSARPPAWSATATSPASRVRATSPGTTQRRAQPEPVRSLDIAQQHDVGCQEPLLDGRPGGRHVRGHAALPDDEHRQDHHRSRPDTR